MLNIIFISSRFMSIFNRKKEVSDSSITNWARAIQNMTNMKNLQLSFKTIERQVFKNKYNKIKNS